MKKKVLIIFLLIMMLILASCSNGNGGVNNLRINFKNNKSMDSGFAAAAYEDRIYYVSNEKNEPGIYSMNLDGSDVQLEAKNPSITSFQIYNNILYFVGLRNLHSDEASYRGFSANEHALYEKKLNESPYNSLTSKYNPKSSINIISFYITPDGIMFLMTGTRELYIYDTKNNSPALKDLETVKVTFKYPISDEIDVIDPNYNKEKEIYFGEIGQTLIASGENLTKIKDDGKKIHANNNIFLIDNITHEINKPYDANELSDKIEILYSDANKIYLSYSDFCDNVQIMVIDKEKWEVGNTFFLECLEEQERISYAIESGNKIYLIADRWSNRETQILPIKKEKLIVLNTDTNENYVVAEFIDGKRIIGIENDYILYIDDNAIYKAEFKDEIVGKEHKLCNMPKNSETNDHTIDFARDWMFVYDIYGGFTYHYYAGCDPGQQLLYKINLKTGEVIENATKLDFSYLDIYRR